MIADDPARLEAAALSPDVLIVGAGAVGIALAVLLARQGQRVTVLEGGPEQPPGNYREANAAASTGLPHLGLSEGRMKALGGTTRLWGGQLMAFAADDLAAGTRPGKPGWPIDHAELVDATDRAMALLGVPLAARDGIAVFEQVTGLPPQLDRNLDIAVSTWLPQPDFARLFATELHGLPALAVLTGHTVHASEFAAPGRISAVLARGPKGRFLRLAAPTVVLANGTIELVGLLLRTARDHPDCGFAGNPHLGRWFIDHLHGIVGKVERPNRKRIADLLDPIHRHGHKFSVKLRASAKLRTEAAICNVAAMVLSPLGAREAISDGKSLARRVFSGEAGVQAIAQSLRNLALLVPLVWRYLIRRRAGALFGNTAYLGIEVEQVACAQSTIALDPDHPDRVRLHWALDGAEMAAITAMAKAVRTRFAESGLGKVVLDPRVEAGDPSFLAECHDAYHQMGGARMAVNAEEGVVDARFKVFGTENLYALGAATFPSGSFANPTLTALALAVRLADHLAPDHG